MPKDRFNDTLTYIRQKVQSHDINLTQAEVQAFERRVRSHDIHGGGDLLSLDWSWYNTRPDRDNRHAIRAVLLAALYARDDQLGLAQTRARATQIKTRALNLLHQDIAAGVRDVIRFTVPAFTYSTQTAGIGQTRTIATCVQCQGNVIEEMDRLQNAGRTIAVMLIDMQSTGDVGQNRLFRHKSVLECQQDVLRKAGELGIILYDIVIDVAQAAENARARTENRLPVLRNGAIETRADLRQHFNGCQVQKVPKPYFESFTGTDLAARLQNDAIHTLIVMGFDANVCVLNTIFGRPETRGVWAPGGVRRTIAEQIQYATAHPNVTGVQLEYTAPVQQIDPLVPGLLDRGYNVVTSRSILASGGSVLAQEYRTIAGQ